MDSIIIREGIVMLAKSEGIQSLTNQSIEELKAILEHEQNRAISIEESREIGESLLTLFEILGKMDRYEKE